MYANMLAKFKKYILKKHLLKHKPTRQKLVSSLKNAKIIAIICDITDEDSYKSIYRIFTQLQEHGRYVKLAGYYDGEKVPFYCLPQLTAEYFCNHDLNWYGLPDMARIKDFVNTEYDMLIDFNHTNHTATESILTLSKAKFIVGRNPECRELYDLLIESNMNEDMKFLELVDQYTRKLTGDEQ